MRMIVLRHGRTAWNAQHRIQGRNDQPLDDFGRLQVKSWRLPADWKSLPCVVSPLKRAQETAEILDFATVRRDDRITEMDWGRYCGHRIIDLRREYGELFHQNENRGIDFCPEAGESPRQVALRVEGLFRDYGGNDQDCVCITHKGVRRAMLVLACGWDMLGRPPVRLSQNDAMILEISSRGVASLASTVSLRAA